MLHGLPVELLEETFLYLDYVSAYKLGASCKRMRAIWKHLGDKLGTLMHIDILKITSFDKEDEAYPIVDIEWPKGCRTRQLSVRVLGRKGGHKQSPLLFGSMHNAYTFRKFYERYIRTDYEVYNLLWHKFAMSHNLSIMSGKGADAGSGDTRRLMRIWQSLGDEGMSEGHFPMRAEELEFIGFDRNGIPVLDLWSLLVHSHVKQLVITAKCAVEFMRIINALDCVPFMQIDKKTLHLKEINNFNRSHERCFLYTNFFKQGVDSIHISATSYPRIKNGRFYGSLKPSYFFIEGLYSPNFANTDIRLYNISSEQLPKLSKIKCQRLRVSGGRGQPLLLLTNILNDDTAISDWEIDIEMSEERNPTEILLNALEGRHNWEVSRGHQAMAIFQVKTPLQCWIIKTPDRSFSRDFHIKIERKKCIKKMVVMYSLEDEPGTSGQSGHSTQKESIVLQFPPSLPLSTLPAPIPSSSTASNDRWSVAAPSYPITWSPNDFELSRRLQHNFNTARISMPVIAAKRHSTQQSTQAYNRRQFNSPP